MKMSKSNNTQARLIRLREVMSMTGLSRSYVYDLSAKGQFPKPLKISERSVAWIESEVQAWIAQCIANRNNGE
jgi:prophage regulatory protein